MEALVLSLPVYRLIPRVSAYVLVAPQDYGFYDVY